MKTVATNVVAAFVATAFDLSDVFRFLVRFVKVVVDCLSTHI